MPTPAQYLTSRVRIHCAQNANTSKFLLWRGFTAKCGTAVRTISFVSDNPVHIEHQRIVILTEFVNKR